nr:LamG-like jellyroll fold domain-containing protein [Burkholderia sp. WSM2230]
MLGIALGGAICAGDERRLRPARLRPAHLHARRDRQLVSAPWRVGPATQNWIGRFQYSGDQYFHGSIDEFRIYRGAMSADQITALVAAL